MNTKKKNLTKQICVLALLTAAGVVLGRLVPVINLWNTKIEFAFVAVMLAACISGPIGGAVVGALVDFIGAILMPTGAYFPGFTVTAAIGGAILGAALYKKRLKLSGCILTALVNGLVVTLILNTTMISLVFGPPLGPLFLTRLGQFGIKLCVQTLVLFFLERSDTLYNKIVSLRD